MFVKIKRDDEQTFLSNPLALAYSAAILSDNLPRSLLFQVAIFLAIVLVLVLVLANDRCFSFPLHTLDTQQMKNSLSESAGISPGELLKFVVWIGLGMAWGLDELPWGERGTEFEEVGGAVIILRENESSSQINRT